MFVFSILDTKDVFGTSDQGVFGTCNTLLELLDSLLALLELLIHDFGAHTV